jgi:hypothetical protein
MLDQADTLRWVYLLPATLDPYLHQNRTPDRERT